MKRRTALAAGLSIICFLLVGISWFGLPDVVTKIIKFEQMIILDPKAPSDQSVDSFGTISQHSDVTVEEDATGGNAGAQNTIQGVPKLAIVALGTMTNGTTETTSYMDDSPVGEWEPVDADVVESADTTIYRVGSASYKMAIATTADTDDGALINITDDNLEANESIGFWIYTDLGLAAGDLTLLIDDTSVDTDFNLPELEANKWQWVEIDISSLTGGSGDVVDKVGITLSAAGAAKAANGAFNVYLDAMYKWDADDEEALGYNLVMDGVLSVLTVATAAGSANTPALEVAYTDYFPNYQSGNDVLVTIADHSANSGTAFIAHQ